MSIKIESIKMLLGDDSGLHNLFVRVRNKHINKDFSRREAIIIKNKENGQKIIRYAMGESFNTDLKKDEIAVDYDGISTLGLKYSKDSQFCNLEIRAAKSFEKYVFFMNHPDLGIQLGIKLGILGATLGFIGLLLGVVSLMG